MPVSLCCCCCCRQTELEQNGTSAGFPNHATPVLNIHLHTVENPNDTAALLARSSEVVLHVQIWWGMARMGGKGNAGGWIDSLKAIIEANPVSEVDEGVRFAKEESRARSLNNHKTAVASIPFRFS